jgi:signal transduction histidine kinase
LLANAVEFSPQGEVVTVSVADLDRRWRITVSDRGPGIDEAFKPRIFGKFAQADASDTRQKGGTGLGLSIVKEIVTRLGGSVSFDSSPGAGTAFHVDLPAADAGQRYPAASFDGAAILHVEDDPDLLLPAAKRGD